VQQLRHRIQPTRLVAARESAEGAALGDLIEPGNLERETQRIPARQHIANRTGHDLLGVIEHVLGEHRQAAHLAAFAVQMVLREGHGLEAEVLGELRELDYLVQHLLKAIGAHRDRTQFLALVHRRRDRRVEKKHESHDSPPNRARRNRGCKRSNPPLSRQSIGRCVSTGNGEMRKFLDILRHEGRG